MSAWTKETPTKPGHYFFRDSIGRKHRVIKVWKYPGTGDPRLFTNEDGGSSVDDRELYKGGEWQAFDLPEPQP